MLDLAELIRTQVPAMLRQARHHRLHFELALESASCPLQPEHVLILLRNLVGNAFRYTQVQGAVRLYCGIEAGHAYLRVSDSGPGIPESMRERVFERFFRLANANLPGSGLGLSIVQRIAETHGATFQLGIGLDGKGLRVEVRFPTELKENHVHEAP